MTKFHRFKYRSLIFRNQLISSSCLPVYPPLEGLWWEERPAFGGTKDLLRDDEGMGFFSRYSLLQNDRQDPSPLRCRVGWTFVSTIQINPPQADEGSHLKEILPLADCPHRTRANYLLNCFCWVGRLRIITNHFSLVLRIKAKGLTSQ